MLSSPVPSLLPTVQMSQLALSASAMNKRNETGVRNRNQITAVRLQTGKDGRGGGGGGGGGAEGVDIMQTSPASLQGSCIKQERGLRFVQ